MKNILKYEHLVGSCKKSESFVGKESGPYSQRIGDDISDDFLKIQIKSANLKGVEGGENIFDVSMSFRTQLDSGVNRVKRLAKSEFKDGRSDKKLEAQDCLAKFRHLLTSELEQNILGVVRKNADAREELKEELRNTIVATMLLLQKVEENSVVGQNKRFHALKRMECSSLNFGSSKDRLYRFKFNLNDDSIFKKELEFALTKKIELENSSMSNVRKIKAFQKTFDSMQKFETYLEKAKEYQEEIDRARKISRSVNCDYHLNEDLKRYVFNNIKDQNYRASLRLEGLHPTLDSAAETLESLRAKYVG